MRIILKFAGFTILSMLFLMPTLVSAQEKTDSGSSARPKSTTTDPTKKTNDSDVKKNNEEIVFPEIDGWEKGEIRTYPSAALGYSVGYQSEEGGTATVYVYNGGLKKVPSELTDETIKNEIDRAKNEILQIGKMGIYEDVKEVKNDTVTLGGANGKVKALRSLFYFKVKGNEVDSEIYLFSYKNNFIKIRSTRPKAKSGAENKVFMSLLAEIDKLFAN